MASEVKIQRWKCVCAYDGTAFSGWQSQIARSRPSKGGRIHRGGAENAGEKSLDTGLRGLRASVVKARKFPAIQDVIEARLALLFGAPVRIHGSGRTDAGVHARGQVFHFDARWRHGPEKLRAALGAGLPQAIQIRSVRAAPPGFHARFSATGKIYTYDLCLGDAGPFERPCCWMIHRPLDFAAMAAAAARLRGRHDFRAFSAGNGGGDGDPEGRDGGTVRDVRRLDLARRGRRLRLTVEGDGFLYKMVRSLAGALVAVGEGRLTPAQVGGILDSRRRTPPVQTAPPQGLFLRKVLYSKKGGASNCGQGPLSPRGSPCGLHTRASGP